MNPTNKRAYKRHMYSGPRKSRKKVQAALKRHHGSSFDLYRAAAWRNQKGGQKVVEETADCPVVFRSEVSESSARNESDDGLTGKIIVDEMQPKPVEEFLIKKEIEENNEEMQEYYFRMQPKPVEEFLIKKEIEDNNEEMQDESTKASTTAVQTITSGKRKKTNAQRCREYRERKKLQNTMVQNITAERSDECSATDRLPVKKPKTNAERRKKYYEAQKLKKQKSKKIPKTDKQRSKEYYYRKKKLKALNTLNHHSDAPEVYTSLTGTSLAYDPLTQMVAENDPLKIEPDSLECTEMQPNPVEEFQIKKEIDENNEEMQEELPHCDIIKVEIDIGDEEIG